jgi:hypothetical protein
MPDPDLAMIFAFITAIVLVISIAAVTMKAIERRGVKPSRELTELGERLARIEQAMESVAIEVERISEGQRFTTRILSERTRESLPS